MAWYIGRSTVTVEEAKKEGLFSVIRLGDEYRFSLDPFEAKDVLGLDEKADAWAQIWIINEPRYTKQYGGQPFFTHFFDENAGDREKRDLEEILSLPYKNSNEAGVYLP